MSPNERIDQATRHAGRLAIPEDRKAREDAARVNPSKFIDDAEAYAAGLARVKRTDQRPAPSREYREG